MLPSFTPSSSKGILCHGSALLCEMADSHSASPRPRRNDALHGATPPLDPCHDGNPAGRETPCATTSLSKPVVPFVRSTNAPACAVYNYTSRSSHAQYRSVDNDVIGGAFTLCPAASFLYDILGYGSQCCNCNTTATQRRSRKVSLQCVSVLLLISKLSCPSPSVLLWTLVSASVISVGYYVPTVSVVDARHGVPAWKSIVGNAASNLRRQANRTKWKANAQSHVPQRVPVPAEALSTSTMSSGPRGRRRLTVLSKARIKMSWREMMLQSRRVPGR